MNLQQLVRKLEHEAHQKGYASRIEYNTKGRPRFIIEGDGDSRFVVLSNSINYDAPHVLGNVFTDMRKRMNEIPPLIPVPKPVKIPKVSVQRATHATLVINDARRIERRMNAWLDWAKLNGVHPKVEFNGQHIKIKVDQ